MRWKTQLVLKKIMSYTFQDVFLQKKSANSVLQMEKKTDGDETATCTVTVIKNRKTTDKTKTIHL